MERTTTTITRAELLRNEFCFDFGFALAEAGGLDPTDDAFRPLDTDLAFCGLLDEYTA
ncbi:hypothetical protein [Paenibacillus antri]|uniref:hypothetical protein n=1 Tax=Paenibacillus antri TaxID=2582848 RepID=UPI0013051BFA|nr:hypothetical protein [Paenibacillus antri]